MKGATTRGISGKRSWGTTKGLVGEWRNSLEKLHGQNHDGCQALALNRSPRSAPNALMGHRGEKAVFDVIAIFSLSVYPEFA